MKGLIETAQSLDLRLVTVAPYFVSECTVSILTVLPVTQIA